MKTYLLILAIIFTGCCRSGDKCEEPAHTDSGVTNLRDGGYDDIDNKCHAACTKLRDMQCKQGNSTPAGTTCEDLCEDMQQKGLILLNPQCVIKPEITSCSEIAQCQQS